MSIGAFLLQNSIEIIFPEHEAVETMVDVATDKIDTKALADWVKNLAKQPLTS
jgi:prophage maintenance system killer protein